MVYYYYNAMIILLSIQWFCGFLAVTINDDVVYWWLQLCISLLAATTVEWVTFQYSVLVVYWRVQWFSGLLAATMV